MIAFYLMPLSHYETELHELPRLYKFYDSWNFVNLFYFSKLLTNLLGHRHDSVTNIRQTRLNSAAIARTWQEFLTIYNYLLRVSYGKVRKSVTNQLTITCANNKYS